MPGLTRVAVAVSDDALAAGPAPRPDEVARSRRLRQQPDRRDWLAVRVLARRLVAEHTGREDVGFVQVCARCGGPHGRPAVVGGGVHVGWSRSGGVVAAVIADVPCAVDVESLSLLRQRHDLPVALLAPSERAWLTGRPDPVRGFGELWVRKEVLVKLGDAPLDAALGLDVLASLDGRPVLGRTLQTLEATAYDAVAAWSTDTTPKPDTAPGARDSRA